MEYLQYMKKLWVKLEETEVLNLVINGIPSIQTSDGLWHLYYIVLNLVINGIPSIPSFG